MLYVIPITCPRNDEKNDDNETPVHIYTIPYYTT